MVDHVERIADTDLLAVLLKAKEITGTVLDFLTHVSGRPCVSNMILQELILG